MKSEIINRNLFSADCEVIAHQVNCMRKMNSQQIRQLRKYFGVKTINPLNLDSRKSPFPITKNSDSEFYRIMLSNSVTESDINNIN